MAETTTVSKTIGLGQCVDFTFSRSAEHGYCLLASQGGSSVTSPWGNIDTENYYAIDIGGLPEDPETCGHDFVCATVFEAECEDDIWTMVGSGYGACINLSSTTLVNQWVFTASKAFYIKTEDTDCEDGCEGGAEPPSVPTVPCNRVCLTYWIATCYKDSYGWDVSVDGRPDKGTVCTIMPEEAPGTWAADSEDATKMVCFTYTPTTCDSDGACSTSPTPPPPDNPCGYCISTYSSVCDGSEWSEPTLSGVECRPVGDDTMDIWMPTNSIDTMNYLVKGDDCSFPSETPCATGTPPEDVPLDSCGACSVTLTAQCTANGWVIDTPYPASACAPRPSVAPGWEIVNYVATKTFYGVNCIGGCSYSSSITEIFSPFDLPDKDDCKGCITTYNATCETPGEPYVLSAPNKRNERYDYSYPCGGPWSWCIESPGVLRYDYPIHIPASSGVCGNTEPEPALPSTNCGTSKSCVTHYKAVCGTNNVPSLEVYMPECKEVTNPDALNIWIRDEEGIYTYDASTMEACIDSLECSQAPEPSKIPPKGCSPYKCIQLWHTYVDLHEEDPAWANLTLRQQACGMKTCCFFDISESTTKDVWHYKPRVDEEPSSKERYVVDAYYIKSSDRKCRDNVDCTCGQDTEPPSRETVEKNGVVYDGLDDYLSKNT